MEQRQGYYTKLFMKGKIQFGKMLKEKNYKQVRQELDERGLAYGLADSWTKLLTKLKEHKGYQSTSNM